MNRQVYQYQQLYRNQIFKMIAKLILKFRNMTMKGQITVLNIIFLLLVLSVGWINYYIQTLIYDFISSSSISQILQYQDQQQIAIISQNLHTIIEVKFTTVLQQMDQLDNYFKLYLNIQNQIISNPSIERCISFEDFFKDNTTLFTPKFCYQAIGVPDYTTLPQNETGLQVLNNFISFLNPISLVIDVSFTGMIEISSISTTKYFAQFPFCVLLPWFDITTLPWYQNHIQYIQNNNTNERFVFAPLNDYFITQYKEMSITMSLIYNNQVIGIIREGLIISIHLVPDVPYNVILIDSDGLVVYQNIESLTNTTNTADTIIDFTNSTIDYFYIYDQNITGFNETDWEQIIQFSSETYKSTIVLENKLQNQSINCYSVNILTNNLTLVVYTNISTMNQYESESQVIKSQTLQIFTQIGFFQLILGAIALTIQVLVIIIVFRPLEQFNKLIKSHALSIGNNVQSEIFKLKHQKTSNDSLSNLQNEILNFSKTLEESRNRKSDVCKIWESFVYEKQIPITNITSIKTNVYCFPDNLEQKIDKLLYKQILQGLH